MTGAAPARAKVDSAPAAAPLPSIFSIDVEDWFHILDIPGAPQAASWDALPSHVEANALRLLDVLDEHRAKATCFFLGWVARRHPRLVKEAARRGHEIASHGFAHRLVYHMSRREFFEDASVSRLTLEDLSGSRVLGYRSAGFSVTERVDWFFETLAEAGYRYDSSVFPAPGGHGGIRNHRRDPHVIAANAARVVEFPVSVADLFGRAFCFFGGGYLRLFPYRLIRRMARQVLAEGRPVVFYVHPREIDPSGPRLPMPAVRRFKSYVNLHTTERKVRKILSEFPVTTFRDFLLSHSSPELAHVP